jgi:hypothetical protein
VTATVAIEHRLLREPAYYAKGSKEAAAAKRVARPRSIKLALEFFPWDQTFMKKVPSRRGHRDDR